MNSSSRQIAEHATFQSFANCYLREIDAGHVRARRAASGTVVRSIEWNLPAQESALRVDILQHSICGAHRFGRISIKRGTDGAWRESDPLPALLALVHESYRHPDREPTERLRGCELELLLRILDSYQSIAVYLDGRAQPSPQHLTFIEAEQSLLFGHWLHPTPKSRQGMSSWQQPSYAPELRGSFRLNFFAVRKSLIRHASAADASVPEITAALAGDDLLRFGLAPDEILIPMHPLQAQALLLDPDIRKLQDSRRLRDLGPGGTPFQATSSVRTVYSADHKWMLKFSLPVRITNSLRVNRRHELDAGTAMARLFARTGFCEQNPRFRVIHDPAYITLDLPGREESGFEVIFRENPFGRGQEMDAVTIAALTADPLPGELSRLEALVRSASRQDGLSVRDAARRWFENYLDCALDPLIGLYDQHGVALEAHQQNSLLDVREFYPAAYYYRDNQGFYLSSRYRAHLEAFVPEAGEIGSLYYDDDDIQDRFAYYLIVNQVFSIISRMGHDGLISEDALLDLLRARLDSFARTMTGAGRDFAKSFLDRPTIATKANLMTRLLDIDELEADEERAVYTYLPNPLRRLATHAIREEAACAIAS
jgi:siderophore synthetase component